LLPSTSKNHIEPKNLNLSQLIYLTKFANSSIEELCQKMIVFTTLLQLVDPTNLPLANGFIDLHLPIVFTTNI
jgi:hypothetical protein